MEVNGHLAGAANYFDLSYYFVMSKLFITNLYCMSGLLISLWVTANLLSVRDQSVTPAASSDMVQVYGICPGLSFTRTECHKERSIQTGNLYLGSISHPCCMNAPSENQRLLNMVKLFVTVGPSVLSSMCHSNGLKRLTRKSTTLTPG